MLNSVQNYAKLIKEKHRCDEKKKKKENVENFSPSKLKKAKLFSQ